MGLIKIGDYVEASDGSGVMGYLKGVQNGNPNLYSIDRGKDRVYICTGVKHVLKQRQLEKKLLEAAGIRFGKI